MKNSENPFEPPVGKAPKNHERKNFSRIGLVAFIFFCSVVTGLDFGFGDLSWTMFVPMVLFIAIPIWAFIDGRKGSQLSAWRLLVGFLMVLLLAPLAYFFLFVTCNITSSSAGLGYFDRGEEHFSAYRSFVAFIGFICTCVTGFILYEVTYAISRLISQLGNKGSDE